MKLFDILILDSRKEKNRKIINNVLIKIKPIRNKMKKEGYKKSDIVPLEYLEKFLQVMYKNTGYCTQWLSTCYDSDTRDFLHYSIGVLDAKRKWIDNVNGKTLWEVYAKVVILMYDSYLKGGKDEVR